MSKIHLRMASRKGGPLQKEQLGYLTGSFQVYIGEMERRMRAGGVQVHTGAPVGRITAENNRATGIVLGDGTHVPADAVIAAVPSALFKKLAPPLTPDYERRLDGVRWQGALCAVMTLKQPLSPIYWMNIGDRSMPFLAVVEHTNFVGPENYGGNHIVYLSNYLTQDHEYFAKSDEDLWAIGTALADAPLLTGGSGIAIGLPENFRRAGQITGAVAPCAAVGHAAILSGSCSQATREQVRRYAQHRPAFAVSTAALMAGMPVADAALAFLHEHAGNAPLIFSTADPAEVAAVQDEFGQEAVARATEALFGELARRAVAAGVRRLVVAGGETSGAVVKALGLRALAIGPEIAPGVPALLATIDGSALALALKSGNFGDGDFFTTAIAMLGGEDV